MQKKLQPSCYLCPGKKGASRRRNRETCTIDAEAPSRHSVPMVVASGEEDEVEEHSSEYTGYFSTHNMITSHIHSFPLRITVFIVL